ncbi:hypothetical protein I3842_02G044100 [Carya illinoinensis]|uniref:Uncharacterized protein n=1 Tax=Carya illinoinensis TaxID=32201 RepID=A0A922FTC0_CARIL|nr:hypothetical protein I3842_02G043900 [Carya illinoinensis]KAG6725681.1 hypothetical protein I3842_02G044100 [Carya illinoinensis]
MPKPHTSISSFGQGTQTQGQHMHSRKRIRITQASNRTCMQTPHTCTHMTALMLHSDSFIPAHSHSFSQAADSLSHTHSHDASRKHMDRNSHDSRITRTDGQNIQQTIHAHAS